MTENKMEASSNKNRSKFSILKKIFSFIFISRVIALTIIILGVYYLTGTNDLSIKGFKLKELKDKKEELVKINQGLELNVMALSSYNNIKSRVQNLKMVAALDVNYLSSVPEAVAKK